MARDLPIIFSGPMVRALLDGRKTMTRRMLYTLRKSPIPGIIPGRAEFLEGHLPPLSPLGGLYYWSLSPWQGVRPGDRLWVRESLTHVTSDPVSAEPCSLHCYSASIPPGMDSANPYEDNYLFAECGTPNLKPRGIPSIHMPRWASRLTLIVTGVKVERLRDISEDDAWVEGVCNFVESMDRPGSWAGLAERDRRELVRVNFGSATNAFHCLFDQLHGPAVWDANPFVVAISFRVINANIDAPEALAA